MELVAATVGLGTKEAGFPVTDSSVSENVSVSDPEGSIRRARSLHEAYSV